MQPFGHNRYGPKIGGFPPPLGEGEKGQAWIKMKLGMQVGLGAGHTVLDGDQAPLAQKGTTPQFSAHVYLMRPNGCMD